MQKNVETKAVKDIIRRYAQKIGPEKAMNSTIKYIKTARNSD
jgi:hypothetical protein